MFYPLSGNKIVCAVQRKAEEGAWGKIHGELFLFHSMEPLGKINI